MPCHWACPLSSFLLASVLLPHNYPCGELLGCSTLSSCNSAPHFWVSSWVISLNKAGGGLRWGSRVLLPSHLKVVSHQKSPLHRTFNATRVLLHLQLELGCAAFHYSSPHPSPAHSSDHSSATQTYTEYLYVQGPHFRPSNFWARLGRRFRSKGHVFRATRSEKKEPGKDQ